MAPSRYLPRLSALRTLAASLVVLVAATVCVTAHADDGASVKTNGASTSSESGPAHQARSEASWWREGIAVFAALWDDTRARLTDDAPDWLHHLSQRKPATTLVDASTAYVVLQDDRADGMDLVTLRYRLAGQGPLRAYAGAGLNHARYFVDAPAAGPSLLTRHNRHSDVGPTAELGAELAVSDRVHLSADLRWADIDDRADLLHTAHGPVAADPVTLGVSLGYRFR